ncbi:MAG: FAD-dependent oxidoreductase [Anaerolineae bacterium]|nr:FAD-dependent oxidoreductase [Anaerolineae bacterium]
MNELHTDVLIVGAGLGGCAAALAALKMGQRVILTEESEWLGGQMTAQGVPPDEHPWIENLGATRSYRELRNRIRAYYRGHYPLTAEAAANPTLNPGMGNVSRLCHEPRVSRAVLVEMLAPFVVNGALQVLYCWVPAASATQGDRVISIRMRRVQSEDEIEISADYFIDATELGDLLPLAGVEHVVGAESQAQTGELHALPGEPNPADQQAFSWCFAIDYLPGQDHTIQKPERYDFWRYYRASFWPAPQLSWIYSDPMTLEPVSRGLFSGPSDTPLGDDLWHFRRILYRKNFREAAFASDIVLVNWVQLDYFLQPLIGPNAEQQAAILADARQLSLSLLYWMQTEAPRLDGGYGYRGLRLRGDVFGTGHGLARSAYIRESRRIKARFTVLEQHVGVEARGARQGAELFHDSVGVGSYRIDLHPSPGPRNFVDITSWPFQIPLGALVPMRVSNLLPGCKNIGTTHITNGCYRLHPVEWNIGEASGALAAFCRLRQVSPQAVVEDLHLTEDFQAMLVEQLGIELAWPDDIYRTPRIKTDPLGI